MDWEATIKGVTAVVAAGVSIYQLRNVLPRQRAHLRADLEILKLLVDKGDPGVTLVRKSIDKQLSAIYGASQQNTGWTRGRIGTLILGSVWAIGLSSWSFYSYHQSNWLWSIVTGIFALVGVFFVIGILVEDKPGNKS